jgi:hypothetical protein
MGTNYPAALDTTTNQPVASALSGVELDGDGDANKVHSTLHGVHSEAIVAIEGKIGTGASTPVANRVLRGTGTGTSAWAQANLTTDITGTLPVANGGTGATALTNLITLGTHSTGNYIATLANATNGGTTIANSGSETAAATVALNLNDLSAGVMADGDSFAFIDSDDSNATKKEALADLLDTIAGTVATTGLDRSGATLVVTDLHPVGVSGSANQILTDDGDGTVTSEANLTFSGSTLALDGNMTVTKDIFIDSTPADTVYSGITASFTAGEALEVGEVVYLKAADTRVWKAVATATATSRAMGMVVADQGSAGSAVTVLLQGFLRADTNFPTWTIGGAIYTPEAETSSKNVPEQTAPDSDGDFVQVLGWAADANTVYFNPSNDIIEHA